MDTKERKAFVDELIKRYRRRKDWERLAACVRERWYLDNEWARTWQPAWKRGK